MSGASSVERCLAALELLAGDSAGFPLHEIASRLDLPKSNMHRLLATMVQSGFVKQDEITQRYLLTMQLTTLGFRFLAGTQIIDLCQPVLDRLAATTSELVRMTMAEGERISWIAKAQGAKTGLRFEPGMGLEVRVHTTASGRAWLMNQPTEFAVRVLLRQGFGSTRVLGVNAPRTVEEFLDRLRASREQGFSIAIDEGELGMSAVAVPFAPEAGALAVGTVSVAGPTARLSRDTLVGFLEPLKAAADELAGLWSLACLGGAERVQNGVDPDVGGRPAP